MRYALQHAEQGCAEDVASETFLIARRRSADVPDQSLPWLLGVARNLLREQADAARQRRLIVDRIAVMTSERDLLAWDTADHVIERATALRALAALPDGDVEALTLVTWHGLSAAEAAIVVGCSQRAFTVRLHRARPSWPATSPPTTTPRSPPPLNEITMSNTDDPMRVMSDLEPLLLDDLAAQGYRHRRQADLDAVASEARPARFAEPQRPGASRRASPLSRIRPRWRLGVAVSAAVALVAGTVVAVQSSAPVVLTAQLLADRASAAALAQPPVSPGQWVYRSCFRQKYRRRVIKVLRYGDPAGVSRCDT